MTVKFRSAFICDDVRQEQNGKRIFIGAYGPNVLLDTFPAQIGVHFVVQSDFTQIGEVACNFRIQVESQEKPIGVSANVTVHRTSVGEFMHFGAILLNFDGPQRFTMDAKTGDEDWVPVGAWNAVLRSDFDVKSK